MPSFFLFLLNCDYRPIPNNHIVNSTAIHAIVTLYNFQKLPANQNVINVNASAVTLTTFLLVSTIKFFMSTTFLKSVPYGKTNSPLVKKAFLFFQELTALF